MAEVKTQQNIPSGWQVLPIGKHIKLQGGNAFSASNYVSDGIPLVRIGNVGKGVFVANDFVYISEDEHANNESVHLRENDILMGMTGELGKVARIGKKHLPAILNQRVGRVVFKDNDMDPEFTFQVFLSKDFISKLEKYFIGAAQKNISSSQVESIEVLLPPIKEQQKIAGILVTVDEDIAKTQEVIDATEKLKRGLMQQLLMDSDNLKGMSFSELVDLRKEKSRPEENNNEKYIALEHLGQGTGSLLSIGHSSDTKSVNSVFKKGDILFTKLRPYLRKYLKAEFDGICTSELLVFIPKLQSDTDFIFQLVQSDSFIQHSVAKSFGTKMPRTDWGIVSEFEIQIPPPKRRQQIGEILSAVDEKISVNKKLKEKLTLLKKGLMQDLLSGTVRTNI